MCEERALLFLDVSLLFRPLACSSPRGYKGSETISQLLKTSCIVDYSSMFVVIVVDARASCGELLMVGFWMS